MAEDTQGTITWSRKNLCVSVSYATLRITHDSSDIHIFRKANILICDFVILEPALATNSTIASAIKALHIEYIGIKRKLIDVTYYHIFVYHAADPVLRLDCIISVFDFGNSFFTPRRLASRQARMLASELEVVAL